mmetsp:Transcript_15101/g.25020  ORF Transcript_15101/g.25020 Transcript_15101/m.25020 type:complete len:262 (+) Transcript_15101:2257-3042(+)
MEGVFEVLMIGFGVVEARVIGLVVCKQKLVAPFIPKPTRAIFCNSLNADTGVIELVDVRLSRILRFTILRFILSVQKRCPRRQPDLGQHCAEGLVWAAIGNCDSNADIIGVCLRIFHFHIKIPILIEDACVQQLKLRVMSITLPILFYQSRIRVLALRILVQELHVRMGWGRVEIPVVLFHILAVIALVVGKTKQALLKDRVLSVPQTDAKAYESVAITEASETILSRAICLRASLGVTKRAPCLSPRCVVLSNRSPLAFT